MALIKCPECGNEISDKALKCPKCGFDTNKKAKKSKSSLFIGLGIGLGILIILLIATIIICTVIVTKRPNNTEVKGDIETNEQAVVETEELIEEDVVDETQKGGRLNPYKKGETATFAFYCREKGTGAEATGVAEFTFTGERDVKYKLYDDEFEDHQYLFDSSVYDYTRSGQIDYNYCFYAKAVDASYKYVQDLGVYAKWDNLFDEDYDAIIYNGGKCDVAITDWQHKGLHYIVITYTDPKHKDQYKNQQNGYENHVDEIWFEVE